MLTTAGNEQDRARANEAGCDDFLTKAIDRRLFLDMARKYADAVERRDFRIPCQIPVLFLLEKSPVGAHVLDLSEGGMFLATRERVLLNQKLRLAFYLEAEGFPLFEVKGRVAWLNEEGTRVHSGLPCGLGLEFVELEDWQGVELKKFMEASGARRSKG